MRGLIATLVVLCLVLDLSALANAADVGPVVGFPSENGQFHVSLEVLVNDRSPSVAWDAFLDRLFGHFDLNDDDRLSEAEAARMMPLPLLNQRQLNFEFAALDKDRNGATSRAELKSFCRDRGFAPVVVDLQPLSADDLRLSSVFRELLDVNNDGEIALQEFARARRSMSRFDLNEDDYLDRDELLSGVVRNVKVSPMRIDVASDPSAEDARLRVNLRVKPEVADVEQTGKKALRAVQFTSDNSKCWRGPNNDWTLTLETRRTLPNVHWAGDFLTAQFQVALGERSELTVSEIKRDATLSGLFELVRFADRNGDDRLGLKELASYTDLLAAAVESQVWIVVSDRGFNLLPFLDADRDGRLGYVELSQAAALGESDARFAAPRQYQITFGAAGVRSWGGMMIPTSATRPSTGNNRTFSGPRWFRALDRNDDGVVNPREFLGPAESFRKLDRNDDGIIANAEATEK